MKYLLAASLLTASAGVGIEWKFIDVSIQRYFDADIDSVISLGLSYNF